MSKQGHSHYFHLHARAPPTEVPGWVDERIPELELELTSNSNSGIELTPTLPRNYNWNLRNWIWNWNLLWVVELELEVQLNWKNGTDPNPGCQAVWWMHKGRNLLRPVAGCLAMWSWRGSCVTQIWGLGCDHRFMLFLFATMGFHIAWSGIFWTPIFVL